MDQELIIELPSDIRSIEHAVEYVMRHCSTSCDYARNFNLNSCVGLTEALSTALLHRNPSDPRKRFRVYAAARPAAVTAPVTDQGLACDPRPAPGHRDSRIDRNRSTVGS